MRHLIVIALLCACTEVADVEPPGDYTTWTAMGAPAPIMTWGNAPGHGDTYRIIYLSCTATGNACAEDGECCSGQCDNDPPTPTYTPTLTCITPGPSMPMGTIVVKEVYNRAAGDGPPAPGSLRVIELARRTRMDSDDQAGWLFSAASEPNGKETVGEFCWRRCHQAAPYSGMWFDYSKF